MRTLAQLLKENEINKKMLKNTCEHPLSLKCPEMEFYVEINDEKLQTDT